MKNYINDQLLYDIVSKKFSEVLNKPLFVVHPEEDLWYTYYNNLPEENRAQFNCNTCKKFIRKYGNICTIDDNYNLKSALWDIDVDNVSEYFKNSVKSLKRAVEQASIISVFISNIYQSKLGVEEDRVLDVLTNNLIVYPHFNINVGARRGRNVAYNNKDIYSLTTDSKNKFTMIYNVISKYDMNVLSKAYTLIKSEYDNAFSDKQKANVIWKNIRIIYI